MINKDFIIGLLAGIFIAILGTVIFILLFTNLPFWESFTAIKKNNYLGKVITLGTILDLLFFAFLIKKDQLSMAKGIIAAVILLALCTLII